MTKSITIRHTKTASHLWKSITQSNVITQELKTVEKPNIFDIEPVTIVHWKTVTKLWTLIEKPNIIA